MKSWKAEVSVFGENCDAHGWHDNALRFATKPEAEAYANDLAGRWTMVKEFRAVESSDPVTHRFDVDSWKSIRIEGTP